MMALSVWPPLEGGTAGIEEPLERCQSVRQSRATALGIEADAQQRMEHTFGIGGDFLIAPVRKTASRLVLDKQHCQPRPHRREGSRIAGLNQLFQGREIIGQLHVGSGYTHYLGMVGHYQPERSGAYWPLGRGYGMSLSDLLLGQSMVKTAATGNAWEAKDPSCR
jgi:hypothetical protein